MTVHLVFDAANTLIHKPGIWDAWARVLTQRDVYVDRRHLMLCHKLVSELFTFPDVTDRAFYSNFNAEVLLALGVVPAEEMLGDLFDACSYLPWAPFDDVVDLKSVDAPMSVISNFSSHLRQVLKSTVPINFEHVVISEEVGLAKPSPDFYDAAIAIIGEQRENIIYVGDSPKLDVAPASALGLSAHLIDRWRIYPASVGSLASLGEIGRLLP